MYRTTTIWCEAKPQLLPLRWRWRLGAFFRTPAMLESMANNMAASGVSWGKRAFGVLAGVPRAIVADTAEILVHRAALDGAGNVARIGHRSALG